jgi:hypothetical protein
MLREHLGKVFREARQPGASAPPESPLPAKNAEMLLRLSGAALALLDWHALDSGGRCRVRRCTRHRYLPWRKRRICPVFATVQFWMEQPLGILAKATKER